MLMIIRNTVLVDPDNLSLLTMSCGSAVSVVLLIFPFKLNSFMDQ